MNKLVCAAGLVAALIVVGCGSSGGGGGGSGVCAGYGGIVDECKEDFTASECNDWDTQGVNGSAWEHYTSYSCEDLGFTVECGYKTWVATSADCP